MGNPCIPYNIGIKAASGDIIVLQPEVMHIGDCLSFINDNLNEKIGYHLIVMYPNFKFNEQIVNATPNEIFNKINNIQFNIVEIQ